MIETRFDPRKPHVVVIYVRMSDEKQNPRSPDQQISEIKALIARLSLPWTIIKIYRDDGISGRLVRERPGFQEMMRDIAAGIVTPTLIAVDTFERFGRAKELTEMRNKLETNYGVLVVTANNHFADPTSSQGRVMGMFEDFRSTEENRVKAHQVLRGKRDAVRQKRWPGGPVPRGYKLRHVIPAGGDVTSGYNIIVPDPEYRFVIEKIFRIADETGWGDCRITQALNGDSEIPSGFKPISGSTVAYVLGNEIYIGVLVYGENNSDIINDQRVIREVEDASEILRVEAFCEPIVDPAVFQRIRDRREQRRAAKKARKNLQQGLRARPLTPGISLVHPLAGLVRCAICRAAMVPSTSGRKSKTGTTYSYYLCPRSHTDACTNRRYVHAEELWRATVSALRSKLFPLGEETGAVPGWLPTIFGLVEKELVKHRQSQPNAREHTLREIQQHRDRIQGWTVSLSDGSLSGAVRAHLQQSVSDALTKVAELEAASARYDAMDRHVQQVLDTATVLDALQALDRVLRGSNINAVNIELAKHIACIDCSVDGTVKLIGTHLGLFDGAFTLLSRTNTADTPVATVTMNNGSATVVARRLSARRVDTLTGSDGIDLDDAHFAADPQRFAGLPPEFFWEENLVIRHKQSWAEKNAQLVLQQHREHPDLSMSKLAKLLGKSRPTITTALGIATGDITPKNLVVRTRKPPAEPDTRDPQELARKARELYDAGKLNIEISRELNLPKARLLELLKSTFGEGEVMLDGRSRLATLARRLLVAPKYQQLADQVHALEEQGLQCREIGAALNVDSTTLTKIRRYWAKSHGVPFLDGRQRRKTLPRRC